MLKGMQCAFFAATRALRFAIAGWLALSLCLVGRADGEGPSDNTRSEPSKPPPARRPEPPVPSSAEDQGQLIRFHPKAPIWLEKKSSGKRVVIVGRVCLREGQLELFACTRGTKEHESVISVPVEANIVHTALLAAGAEPGQTAQFQPEYKPASGTEIDVLIYWTDADGHRRRARAQDWVKDLQTGQKLAEPWVFAGSGFWVNEQTGQSHYMADAGDLICVSNFSTAMLDLPIESSDKAGQLLFEAYTERIPPKGTKVTLVLAPKVSKNDAGE